MVGVHGCAVHPLRWGWWTDTADRVTRGCPLGCGRSWTRVVGLALWPLGLWSYASTPKWTGVDRRGRGWRVPVVPAQKRGRFARRSITVSTSGGGLRHGIQRRNSTFTARKHRNSAPHSTHSPSAHLGSPLMIGRRIFAARLRASAFFDIARRRPRSPGYLRYRDIGGSSEFALVAVGSASKLPFRVLTTTRLAKLPAS